MRLRAGPWPRRDFAAAHLLEDAQRVDLVVLPGRDRYDRGLARLIVQQLDVADTLVSEGLARRYNGGKRLGWCQ